MSWPCKLQSLTLSDEFGSEGYEGMALPDRLQTLTFGFLFDRSLQNVALP